MHGFSSLVAMIVGIFTALCLRPTASQCTSRNCFEADDHDEVSTVQGNLNMMWRFMANRDHSLMESQEELIKQGRALKNQRQLLFDLMQKGVKDDLSVATQQRAFTTIRDTLYEIQMNISALQRDLTSQRQGDSLAAMVRTLTSYEQHAEEQNMKLKQQNELLQTLRDEITGR